MLHKKRVKGGSCTATPMGREISNLVFELISQANRAETISQTDEQIEVTHAGELLAARNLIASQQALADAIAHATRRDLTVPQIRAEIVEPILDHAVVGDMAWMMLCSVLDTAENTRRGLGQVPVKRSA